MRTSSNRPAVGGELVAEVVLLGAEAEVGVVGAAPGAVGVGGVAHGATGERPARCRRPRSASARSWSAAGRRGARRRRAGSRRLVHRVSAEPSPPLAETPKASVPLVPSEAPKSRPEEPTRSRSMMIRPLIQPTPPPQPGLPPALSAAVPAIQNSMVKSAPPTSTALLGSTGMRMRSLPGVLEPLPPKRTALGLLAVAAAAGARAPAPATPGHRGSPSPRPPGRRGDADLPPPKVAWPHPRRAELASTSGRHDATGRGASGGWCSWMVRAGGLEPPRLPTGT